jgi:hypothetical protein
MTAYRTAETCSHLVKLSVLVTESPFTFPLVKFYIYCLKQSIDGDNINMHKKWYKNLDHIQLAEGLCPMTGSY